MLLLCKQRQISSRPAMLYGLHAGSTYVPIHRGCSESCCGPCQVDKILGSQTGLVLKLRYCIHQFCAYRWECRSIWWYFILIVDHHMVECFWDYAVAACDYVVLLPLISYLRFCGFDITVMPTGMRSLAVFMCMVSSETGPSVLKRKICCWNMQFILGAF